MGETMKTNYANQSLIEIAGIKYQFISDGSCMECDLIRTNGIDCYGLEVPCTGSLRDDLDDGNFKEVK